MNAKRIASLVLALTLLLALPFSVQAATWTNAGITLVTPDDMNSCSPSGSISASGLIPGEWVDVWFFQTVPGSYYATPIYHQSTFASASGTLTVAIPYPAITGEMIFFARIDVMRESVLTKVEGQWHVTCGETPGGEGCTPGYWKNHLDSWGATGYSPSDDFDTVFGVDYFTPDVTLLQALNLGGGDVYRLGRHGTAALLDAAHSGVDYPYTVAEVISMVQAGNADALEAANETYCPLN